jgi:hypothetical protein
MTALVIVAVGGFESSAWIIVAVLAGQGIVDVFHCYLVDNSGVLVWWPAFCVAYDFGAAACLAGLRQRRAITAARTSQLQKSS